MGRTLAWWTVMLALVGVECSRPASEGVGLYGGSDDFKITVDQPQERFDADEDSDLPEPAELHAVNNALGSAALQQTVAELQRNNGMLRTELGKKDRLMRAMARLLLQQPNSSAVAMPSDGGYLMVPLGAGCCSFETSVNLTKANWNRSEDQCQRRCEKDHVCRAVELSVSSASTARCHIMGGAGAVSVAPCRDSRDGQRWCYIKWTVASLLRETQALLVAQGNANSSSPSSPLPSALAPPSAAVLSPPLPGQNRSVRRAKAMVKEAATEAIKELTDTLYVALGQEHQVSHAKDDEDKERRALPQNMKAKANSPTDGLELLTSITLNVGLLVLSVLLLKPLRRWLPVVFCPKGAQEDTEGLEQFWADASDTNDAALLEASGLDGLMLLKFLRLGLRLCLITGTLNIVLLCPAHWMMSRGEQFLLGSGPGCLTASKVVDKHECWKAAVILGRPGESAQWIGENCFVPNELSSGPSLDPEQSLPVCKVEAWSWSVLDRLSIRSTRVAHPDETLLWLDTASVLLVTAVTIHLLSRLLGQFSRRRRQYLLSTSARATVFVRRIPSGITGSGLRDFFDRLFPGRVEAAVHVHCPALRGPGAVGNGGGERLLTPCGFVSFRSVRDAHHCAQLSLSSDLTAWKADLAPEPEELLWPNIFATTNPGWLRARQAFAILLLSLLFTFWSIPITLLSTMANLEYLEDQPCLKHYMDVARQATPGLYASINRNLSAFYMTLFMSILPLLIEWINGIYGYPTRRLIDSAVERQYFSFCLFYVLLMNAISQSLLKFMQVILQHPPDALVQLAEALPQVSTWYMCYVTFTLMGLAIVMTRPYQLCGHFCCWLIWGEAPEHDFYVQLDEPFGTMAARWTLYLSIALVYSSMMPLILPLAALAFGSALWVYKYQLLCIQRPTYDTGGLWVPVAASNVQIVLAVYQVTMLGILKGDRSGMPALLQALAICASMAANYGFHRYSRKVYNYHFLPLDAADVPDVAKPLAIYEAPTRLGKRCLAGGQG